MKSLYFTIYSYNIPPIFIYKECKTNEGPSTNIQCIFPFKFDGKPHSNCINSSDGYWCSTKLDSLGIHIGGKGNWGVCSAECPFPGLQLKCIQQE